MTDNVTVDGCAYLGDVYSGNTAYLIGRTPIDNVTNTALILGIWFRDNQIGYPIPINVSCSSNFSASPDNFEAIAAVEIGKGEAILFTS